MDKRFAPQTFSAGYIALSYVISFIGSLSTVELLQLRTSRRGIYNWYLLAGSSVTMGGVAIWAMHYIGNRAIILYPDSPGREKLQLTYSPGYTALSFFIPIVSLFMAYLLMGAASDGVSWVRLSTGGTVAGLAICGMHYLGQAGISNYSCYYISGHVAGSVVIAVVATKVALTLFFILRKNFTNSWYKRVLCAVVLSGAVSGMHWTASLGTRYKPKTGTILTQDTRDMAVTITIVMSVVSCVIMVLFAIRVKESRTYGRGRAQKIILASATFDPDGKLMVLPDGVLPTKEITDVFLEKSFEEGFDKSHIVFQWIYRTTRHWRSLNGLTEGMKEHLRQYHSPNRPADDVEDYSFIFREQFCVAAQDLADGTHRILDDMGVLYDEIIITGGSSLVRKYSKIAADDVEAGHGRGKFLFLVQRVSKPEAARLTTHGYVFTSPSNVVDNIAKSMQVSKETIRVHVGSMGTYASTDCELLPGVYLGCFAVRANVKGSFDILVHTNSRNQLPTVKLPIETLGQTELRFLQEQENKTVTQIINSSHVLRRPGSGDPSNISQFVIMFHDALRALNDELKDPFFSDAILILTPIDVPCLDPINKEISTAHIITFKTMVPIHSRTISKNTKFQFSSLPFFSLQQRCYPFSPDHDIHARRTHREFSGKIAYAPQPLRTKFANKLTPWRSKGSGPNLTAPVFSSRTSSSSEKKLVAEYPNANPFGGIMVSQSVSVEHAEVKSSIELHSMGPSAAIVKEEDMESPTWVDLLFKGTVATGR